MSKFFTVKDMIKFLEQFPEDLPVVLKDNPMGWVNGVIAQEDTVYFYDRSKTNKTYMYFEDDHVLEKYGKKRKPRRVVKIGGFYK